MPRIIVVSLVFAALLLGISGNAKASPADAAASALVDQTTELSSGNSFAYAYTAMIFCQSTQCVTAAILRPYTRTSAYYELLGMGCSRLRTASTPPYTTDLYNCPAYSMVFGVMFDSVENVPAVLFTFY